MSTDGRDYEKELERLAEGLAESALEASEEEILEEIRASGRDPEEVAKEARSVLEGALTRYRKGRLKRARERYERRVEEMSRREVDLPSTPQGRLALLIETLRWRPQYQGMLTVQFRDLAFEDIESLPDEDVVSLLRQLAALGALDER